ncbi:MAG: 30S ribosome-binding factor RbfA [Actinobacteria bacterium]|nr:30S ribosome-binding factor RbfA [Actinomycetota bacterium]
MDRVRKIAADLKREISFIINNKVKDPRIGFLTVTDVELSSDYKWFTIYISIMGTAENREKSMNALNSCGGFIKKNLVGKFRLRSIPEIKFVYDSSIDRGMKIESILKEIERKKVNS